MTLLGFRSIGYKDLRVILNIWNTIILPSKLIITLTDLTDYMTAFKDRINSIKTQITAEIGKKVTFDNGCSIDLTPNNGYFFGTNPYGVDWMCENKENYIQVIAEWVHYWDSPRTETGEIIYPESNKFIMDEYHHTMTVQERAYFAQLRNNYSTIKTSNNPEKDNNG